MAVFGLLSFVARIVIWVVAVLQFLLVLITGEGNSNLRDLGQGASKWTYQAYMFVTFNSDNKPFPFSDWPEIDQQEGISATSDTAEVSEPEDADEVPAFIDAGDDDATSNDKS